MPQFAYKARRRSGEVVQGVLEVADRGAALLQIEKSGLYPVQVEASGGVGGGGMARAGNGTTNLMPAAVRDFLARKRKPKLQELATYTHQLANLLKSGMPLTVALHSMTHLESRGISSEVSRQLKQDVMEGRSLSDAMVRQRHIFSDLYVNMVRAGEQSGALVDVLRRMGDHYIRFAEVQSKFTSALVYPAIVMVLGVVILFFFMTVMLPNFMKIFDDLKVPLPPATQMLIGLSHLLTRWWWLVVAVMVAAVILFRRFQGTEAGRMTIDRWKLRAPIVGKVMRLNLFGQFARTLSTLLENGVPVLTALKITEEIIQNKVLQAAIARTRQEVTDGKTIAQPLARSQLFPQLMVDLVRIGEETGDVPGALSNLAETYENELKTALAVMTSLIQPAIIIVMAMGVGFLLFSVLSAMFAITANLNR